MKRRGLIAAAVVIAAAGVAVWFAMRRPRPQPGTIQDVFPLDAQRALLVRSDRRGSGGYLELVDARHELRWRRGFPVTMAPRMGWEAEPKAVLAGRTLAIRDLNGHVRTFDAEKGTPGWHANPMAGRIDERGGGFRLLWLDLLARPDLLVEFAGHDEEEAVAIAVDPATGRERWRKEFPSHYGGPAWFRRDQLVINEGDALEVVDLATGQTRKRLEIRLREACVAGDSVLTLRDGQLRELSIGDLTERVLPLGDVKEEPRLTTFCGRREGTWVVAIADGYGTQNPGGGQREFAPAVVLVIDPVTGALWRRIELGTVQIGRGAEPRFGGPEWPERSGEFTRFVPLVVRSMSSGWSLVMLDLDVGEVAWSGKPWEQLLHASLATDGVRHYLLDPIGAFLAAFDGETGRLLAAVKGPEYMRIRLTQGHVWAFGFDDWAVLNGHTLAAAPDTKGTLDVVDARREVQVLLGSRAGRNP